MKTSSGIELAQLPAGSFLMGDPHGPLSGPVHRVTLSSFWIGKYPVTNAEFEAFRKRPRPPEAPGDRDPACGITWWEADEFCKWLTAREHRPYRLPTEAEWEYAARGGLEQKQYPWGDEDWPGRAALGMPHAMPVGSFPPNGYGLYDMAGNVQQWVSDWDSDYTPDPVQDPQGPPNGGLKIIRNGGFKMLEAECWWRLGLPQESNSPMNGLRVAMSGSSATRPGSRTR